MKKELMKRVAAAGLAVSMVCLLYTSHVMKSLYDERSSHLDVKTGAPMDTRYE